MNRRPLTTVMLVTTLGALAILVWTSWPSFVRPGSDGPITNPTDFRAFYCAGAAVLLHANPYLVEPIQSCELRAAAQAGLHIKAGLVLPAPHPPYAELFFAAFALMPFRVATIVWLASLLAAACATIVAVARLTGLRLAVVAGALFMALAYGSLVIGQVVPPVLCALSLAALAVRQRRAAPAAALLTFAMIEPHLGLPAALAAFVAFPWLRRGLLIGGAVLAALSLLAVGAPTVVQYFMTVLPLHAASEVTAFGGQYGLSPLLYALGLSERSALALGSLSYASMLALGIWAGVNIARKTADAAFAILAAPAFVLIGGTFLHIHQIAVALPLALLLLVRYGPRPALVVATVCLAIPWGTIAEMPAVARLLAIAPPNAAASVRFPAPRPDDIAEIPEMRMIRSGGFYDDRRTNGERFAIKFPTWFGLIVIAGYACALAGSGRKAEAQAGMAVA